MKIKDLTPEEYQQVGELEIINILPVLKSVGLPLEEKHMWEQLEHFANAEIVLTKTENRIDGFFMFVIENRRIQLVSFNMGAKLQADSLRDLLRQFRDQVATLDVDEVTSRAHLTNTRSINFHKRMGFTIQSSNEHHHEFRASKDALLEKVKLRV
ncbi:hypothetical protein [Bdellovibrio sp. HCB2-146]|uniref:hypothetical protein n=1 Tax=Bdellovibrio sp. HCB2-146 TaxID=3394362 RepID=UPI0039BC6165